MWLDAEGSCEKGTGRQDRSKQTTTAEGNSQEANRGWAADAQPNKLGQAVLSLCSLSLAETLAEQGELLHGARRCALPVREGRRGRDYDKKSSRVRPVTRGASGLTDGVEITVVSSSSIVS